ncbi:uncharacterized protein LOC112505986 [Cynara cardunculus var. scolymus]|uniref:uncharacterized protein LOC112505986 n=1 Tax=Cynara cardunculus var. scolymus TaxID=59895 RepID=UPI000D627201|nr:uncharacterized protein LOC112505986 [Cynara cardunculus var. scolymus]
MGDMSGGISSNEMINKSNNVISNGDECDVNMNYRKKWENHRGSELWVPKVLFKEGIPLKKEFDSLEASSSDRRRRNTNFKRNGCKACLKVHYVKKSGHYEVYKFVETHNHMLCRPDEMMFSRSRRQLDYKDRKNVYHTSSSKVGITQSRRMQLAIKGGLESIGGTARDHINFKRDIVLFYDEKELIAIFWADETARSNYKHFGDTISFDATFWSNKHAMIFVPFVAIDNHKKSVVVGASLIRSEYVINLSWVLKAFMKAHGRQPQKMNAMMDEYGLRGHSWFEEMYTIRESWIPAYSKDYPMSGLMKTTSRYARWFMILGKSLLIVVATILFAMAYYIAMRLRYGEMDVEKQVMINQVVSMFDLIIGRVRKDKNSLAKFVDQLEQWVDILPPTGIRNKGCGTGKRLVGISERTSVNAKKPKRLCITCEKMAWHDSRNCPSKSDGTK